MLPPGNLRSTVLLHQTFKAFRKRVRDIWESYNLIDHYSNSLHSLLKKEQVAPLELPPLMKGPKKRLSIEDTQGALNHLQRKANPRRTLIDCIGEFENYLGRVLFILYTDFPRRLSGPDTAKVMEIIHDSQDKAEIIERIAEERIRGMFYGNPTEIFCSKKAFPDFRTYFKDNYEDVLNEYAELTSRRNLLIHHAGKVDRKYILENKNTSLKLNQIVPLQSEYLRNALSVLEGLSAIATQVIVVRVYKETIKGKLSQSIRSFHSLRGISPKRI